MNFNYPLSLKFRILALAPRIEIHDATNQEIFFIEQKILALKEKVSVYSNSQKTQQLFFIQATKIIDIGATYLFYPATNNQLFGSVKQQGLRTFWKATYDILDTQNQPLFQITEKNPWIKVGDFAFSNIPFLGLLAGYIFHAEYLVRNIKTNQIVMSLKKEPSLLERSFKINLFNQNLSVGDEILCLLALMVIVQLEQSRG